MRGSSPPQNPRRPLVREFGGGRVVLVQADITTLDVDAIVNAANSSLAGGGGVDGAIHRAGGPEIMRELNERYSGCPTGSAVITGGGRLPAKAVIHAVGPRWRDGEHSEPDLLASAYRRAFALAREQGHATVAAPSISTGIYGFPIERGAPIALGVARDALLEPVTTITEITFALFSPGDVQLFADALAEL
ncbi:MAG: macro domain-containing protein [Candidatus Dormibacteraeota bacterium]|nr:macro domain-containing protein [Candidatus Dormibacteraeota bacterium]